MMTTLSRNTFAALAFALAATPTLAATLVGSGKSVTETRAVAGFSGVGLAIPGVVELTQGDTESLVITADDNVLPEIETVVENGSLKIRFFKRNFDVTRADIRIKLTARTIEHLAIGGSGDIRSGPLKAKTIALSIGGSGDMTVASIVAGEVKFNVGGSGNIKVGGGTADTMSTSIAGSGNLSAKKLAAKTATVSIAGSGSAILWATDTLSLNVVGSGNVHYYGDAKVSRTVMGSGDVKRLGATPS